MLFLYESFAYKAFKSHQLISSASVFAEATLLTYDLTAAMFDILFVSETRSRGSVVSKFTSVKLVQSNIGQTA